MKGIFEGKKILFIGAGNMAEAIIQGLIQSGFIDRSQISFTEIRQDRTLEIHKKYGIRHFSDIKSALETADIVIFAVKPQAIGEVFNELKSFCVRGKLLISILAGTKTSKYEDYFGSETHVIRVMPNMAALIGMGVSGLSRGKYATDEDERMAQALMSSVGEVVSVAESLLDAVTAVSGSGPAYFFYFMEAMEAAACRLGLDPVSSQKLTRLTALGAAQLVIKGTEDPAVLRKRVTSPGGTTEAAIAVFEKEELKKIIINALCAAQKRSKELSQS